MPRNPAATIIATAIPAPMISPCTKLPIQP
jgi:hypothetical protein